MTPQQFIVKWKQANLTERSAAQSHFLDLCELLQQPTPAKPSAPPQRASKPLDCVVSGQQNDNRRGKAHRPSYRRGAPTQQNYGNLIFKSHPQAISIANPPADYQSAHILSLSGARPAVIAARNPAGYNRPDLQDRRTPRKATARKD